MLEVAEVTALLGVLWLLFLASLLLLFTLLLVTISQLFTLLLSSLLLAVVQGDDDDVGIVGKAVVVGDLDASPAPPATLDAGASLNGDEWPTGDPPTLSSTAFATEFEGVPQSGPGNV